MFKTDTPRTFADLKCPFVSTGLFFMCWGPYVILNFWSVNNETKPIPYSADLFTTLLAFANSCVNPVLFVLLNKDFRRRVRMLGRKLTPCLGHRQPSDATDNGLSAVHTRLEADDAMMRSQEREVARRAEVRTGHKLSGSSSLRVAWQWYWQKFWLILETWVNLLGYAFFTKITSLFVKRNKVLD